MLCYLLMSFFISVYFGIFVALVVCLSVNPFSGLRPRRTLRTVLWTAEEQGGVGAQQYYNLHKVLTTVTEVPNRKRALTSIKQILFLQTEEGSHHIVIK